MENACFFGDTDLCYCPLTINSKTAEKKVSLILHVHLQSTIILKDETKNKKRSPVMLARDFYRSVENTDSIFATDQPKVTEK